MKLSRAKNANTKGIFFNLVLVGNLFFTLFLTTVIPQPQTLSGLTMVAEDSYGGGGDTSSIKKVTDAEQQKINQPQQESKPQEKNQPDDECYVDEDCGKGSSCKRRGGTRRCVGNKQQTNNGKATTPASVVSKTTTVPDLSGENECESDFDCLDNYFCNRSKKPHRCVVKKAPVNYCPDGNIVITNGHQWCFKEKGEEPTCLDCPKEITPSSTRTITPSVFVTTTPTPIYSPPAPPAEPTTPATIPYPTYVYSTPTTFINQPTQSPVTPQVYHPTEEPSPTSYINPTIPTTTPFTVPFCKLSESKCENGYVLVCSLHEGTYYFKKTSDACPNQNQPTVFIPSITPTVFRPTVSDGETCVNPLGFGCACVANLEEKIISSGVICEKIIPDLRTNDRCDEQLCKCHYSYGIGNLFSDYALISSGQTCRKDYYCSKGVLEGLSCILAPKRN